MITNTPTLWTVVFGYDVLYVAAWLIILNFVLSILVAIFKR